MSIHKYLDLSTGFVPHDEWEKMVSNPEVISTDHEYGRWVWANTDLSLDTREALPELCKIIDYAVAQDCNWINFDQDASDFDDDTGLTYYVTDSHWCTAAEYKAHQKLAETPCPETNCSGTLHQCNTGDLGCLHCSVCSYMKQPGQEGATSGDEP